MQNCPSRPRTEWRRWTSCVIACLLLTFSTLSAAQVRVENYRGRDSLNDAMYPAVPPFYINNDSPSSNNLPNLEAFAVDTANIESTLTETDIDWSNASQRLCNILLNPSSAACQARRQGRVAYALVKFPVAGTYAFDVAHDDEVDVDFSTQFTVNYRNANYNVPVGSVPAFSANENDFQALGSYTATGDNTCFLMRIYWNNRGRTNYLRMRWDPPGQGVANRAIIPASALLDPADPANVSSCANTISDLAIAKTGPATYAANSAIAYTIKVWNRGPAPVTAAVVQDVFPASLSGVTWTCVASGAAVCGSTAVSGNTRTQTTGLLPVNNSATPPTTGDYLTINVTATTNATATSIANTATVSPPPDRADADSTNNSSTTTATRGNAPQLTMLKSHVGDFVVGSNASYQLSVSNGGTAASSGTITVVDTLPAGLGFVSATGSGWTCNAAGQVVTCTTTAVLAIGATSTPITLTVLPAAAAVPSVINSARINGGGDTTCPAPPATAVPRCTATDPTTVRNAPSIGLAKSANGPWVVGQGGALYTLTVSNLTAAGGASTVGTITVVDALPAGITPNWSGALTSNGWSCTFSGQTVTCTSTAALAPGASSAMNLPVNVTATAANPSLNAAAVSGGGDTDPAPTPGPGCTPAEQCAGTSTPINRQADLQITKTNTPAAGPNDQASDTVTSGATTTYDIVVSNVGPSPASNAVLRDPAPTNLGSCTLGVPPCAASGGAVCPSIGAGAGQLSVANLQSAGGVSIPTLPSGGSLTVKLTCTVQ